MLLEGTLHAMRRGKSSSISPDTNPVIYNGDLPVRYNGVIVAQILWEQLFFKKKLH